MMNEVPPKWGSSAFAFTGLVSSFILVPWHIRALDAGTLISMFFQSLMLCAFAFNFHGVFDFVQKVPKNCGSAIVSVAKFLEILSSGLGGTKPNPIRLSKSSVNPSMRLSMRTLILLSLFVNVANGCGNNAWRCVNARGSVDDDWVVTRACMKKVGFDSTCYCSHMAETYADPFGSDVDKFRQCCYTFDNYVPREC